MSISVFIREISKNLGVLPIDITIRSKTSLSALFVINSITSYNVLLGRDWINSDWCVSPSHYQILLFWKGEEVEVLWADKQPFIATLDYVEASYYDQEFGLINFKCKKKDEAPRKIYMELRDADEIQDQATKLLKIPVVVLFRSIKVLIIK